jgi:hypothetical protein
MLFSGIAVSSNEPKEASMTDWSLAPEYIGEGKPDGQVDEF